MVPGLRLVLSASVVQKWGTELPLISSSMFMAIEESNLAEVRKEDRP